MKSIMTFCVIICTSLALGSATMTNVQPSNLSFSSIQDQDQDQAQDKRNILEKARQVFMRSKLDSNKKIVEGLTTKNFDKIKEGAEEIKALTKGQHWVVIDTERYKQYSRDMEKAATLLQEAAEKKNIEAAALRYFGSTMNCVDCHRYIESRRH